MRAFTLGMLKGTIKDLKLKETFKQENRNTNYQPDIFTLLFYKLECVTFAQFLLIGNNNNNNNFKEKNLYHRHKPSTLPQIF